MYSCLKKDGVFSYEGVDVSDKEYFSYPTHPVVNKWFRLIHKNWKSNKMHITFVKWLYQALKNAKASALKIDTNQIILTTPEEKSIIRFGLMSAIETYYKKNFVTQAEYEEMILKLKKVENSNTIVGYVRNILVSARKN